MSSEKPRKNVLAYGKNIPGREMLTKKFMLLENPPPPPITFLMVHPLAGSCLPCTLVFHLLAGKQETALVRCCWISVVEILEPDVTWSVIEQN